VEEWKQQEEFGPPNIRMSIDISGSIDTVFDMNSVIVVGRFAGWMRAFAIELMRREQRLCGSNSALLIFLANSDFDCALREQTGRRT